MNKKIRLLHAWIAAAILLGACNLPSNTPEDASATSAAQTVEALLSATPLFTATTLPPFNTVTPISTGVPTNTTVASATPVCNLAQFVSDPTIPDGTVMNPNQTFNKKWRLRNIGVCAWNGFSLVFDSGESMGGPASKPIPAVGPGQEVDLDVDLKAPANPGTYRGYWRIVTNNNVLVPVVNGYQGRAFYVEIKVQGPPTATNTSPPSSTTVTLNQIAGESGQVRSDGTVLNPPNTGDIESNTPAQAFLSFNMTSIPAGATITKVVVDFSSYDTLGNPWSLGDGCVRAYVQNYGTMDAGDFFPGDPTGAVTRWCSAAELSSAFEDNGMKAAVQTAVGSSRLQLRIQFRAPTTNGNGIADMIRFGTVKLIITYQ
jgi:hypothetical protein